MHLSAKINPIWNWQHGKRKWFRFLPLLSKAATNHTSARATSAAPPYFKHFTKNETKNGYIDGALYHNNPVNVAHHERMLIWKDVGNKQPDIFLSIGTGDQESPPRPDRIRKTFVGQLWDMGSSRVESILNCTKIWNDFRIDVVSGPYRNRYIRLNPNLGSKVPKLDDVGQLQDVQQATNDQLKTDPQIIQVAHRLIASTFFFERIDASIRERDGSYECDG